MYLLCVCCCAQVSIHSALIPEIARGEKAWTTNYSTHPKAYFIVLKVSQHENTLAARMILPSKLPQRHSLSTDKTINFIPS